MVCAISKVLNVAMWQNGKVAAEKCSSCPKSAKSNLRGPKITASMSRNYVSFQFSDFVLKIAPIGGRKFGGARLILYLCIVNQKTGAQSN